MSKKEKIEIGYNFREKRIDFGMINDAIGNIKVNRKWWEEYCKKRMEFETMHDNLVKKISKKHLKAHMNVIFKDMGFNKYEE